MKKNIVLSFLLALLLSAVVKTQPANAWGVFYTEATYPTIATGVKSTKPLNQLKKGTAITKNILGCVETGDSGIKQAAQNAGIKQVNFIDTSVKSIFIFVRTTTTTVYGE